MRLFGLTVTILLTIGMDARATDIDTIMAELKAHCAGKWPGKFAMQEWCIDRELDSQIAVVERLDAWERGDPREDIAAGCMIKWVSPYVEQDPNHPIYIWSMVLWCVDRELGAYERLQAR